MSRTSRLIVAHGTNETGATSRVYSSIGPIKLIVLL